MFKKVLGLIAGFFALMFFITLFQVKVGTKTTAKELEDKVIVYTTYDKSMTDIVKSEFEKSTSIKVEITKFSNDTDMVNALKTKKDVVPDVLLGSSTDTYEELKKEDLLEANKPSWYYDISDDEKDKDGYWYSLFGEPIVMFYNTAMLKPEEIPQNLISLNDKKYANLLVMPDMESTDFKYFLNTVISPYVKDNKVDDGFKAVSALKFNIKEYKDAGDKVVDAVAKKEGAVGFASLSKVNESIKKGSTLAVAYGSEKYPMTADGIAVVKNCTNINAAKLFEEFAAGPKMQYKIAQKFKLNPTNKKSLDLCGGELSELKDRTYEIDMSIFKANIDSWVGKWKAIVKAENPTDNKDKHTNAENTNANNPAAQVNNNNSNAANNNNAVQNNTNTNTNKKQPANNTAQPQQNNANTSGSTNNNSTPANGTNKQQDTGKTQNNAANASNNPAANNKSGAAPTDNSKK